MNKIEQRINKMNYNSKSKTFNYIVNKVKNNISLKQKELIWLEGWIKRYHLTEDKRE